MPWAASLNAALPIAASPRMTTAMPSSIASSGTTITPASNVSATWRLSKHSTIPRDQTLSRGRQRRGCGTTTQSLCSHPHGLVELDRERVALVDDLLVAEGVDLERRERRLRERRHRHVLPRRILVDVLDQELLALGRHHPAQQKPRSVWMRRLGGHDADELRERKPLVPDDQLDRGAVGLRLDRPIAADAPADRALAGHDRGDRSLVAERQQDVALARALDEVAPDRVDDVHQCAAAGPAAGRARDRDLALPLGIGHQRLQ